MKRIIWGLGLVLTLACSQSSQQAEPTWAAVIEQVRQEGEGISLKAQKALGGQLMKVLAEEGPEGAVAFCTLAAYPILDTIDTKFDVTIKRASLRIRNPKDAPTEVERAILTDYEDQLKNGQPLTTKVEVLDQGKLLFAKPILLNNPMCLNCHGQLGSEVSQETYDFIQSQYPEDNAVNHAIGDLRGIWSITFQRQEVWDYLKGLTENAAQIATPDQQAVLDKEAQSLMETHCYACHNPKSTSHDDILAPPLAGIKKRYLHESTDRADFIRRMATFVSDPKEELAIMHGPVRRFGLMPKTALNEQQIQSIVSFIFDNEVPEPAWFEAHEQERHGGSHRHRDSDF